MTICGTSDSLKAEQTRCEITGAIGLRPELKLKISQKTLDAMKGDALDSLLSDVRESIRREEEIAEAMAIDWDMDEQQ